MNFKRMLIISRPIAWVWTIGGFLVGIGNFSNFTTISIIEFLFMFLPINFIIYGLNDIYDRKSDAINPNKKYLAGAIIEKFEIKKIKIISAIFSIIFILIAITSKNIEHILMSSLFILMAYIYSVPPIRMKSKPFLDTIFGSIGYLLPILIAFTSHDSLSNINPIYLLLILPLMAGHSIFAIRDIKYDKKAKIKTMAIILGPKKTLIFITLMYMISAMFLQEIFFKAIFIALIIALIPIFFTDLKKGKYIPKLIKIAIFSVNLSLIYFILKTNFG